MLPAAILIAACLSGDAGAQNASSSPADAVPIPASLLRPIPATGAVPRITDAPNPMDDPLSDARAEQRDHHRELVRIRDRAFRTAREQTRRAGIEDLRLFKDPSSFKPMMEVMAREKADVRLAMLDHFADCGDEGQAALAYAAIHDSDPAFRQAATAKLRRPAAESVLRVIDDSLRDTRHAVVNNAGMLAGNMNILAAIPPMIFGQLASDQVRGSGDLAWIAIGTTKTYIANVVPIVGDNSGAFAPVIGSIVEGVVLRVNDAVAYSYRTDLHHALVSMTTADFGESTEQYAYDMRAWWEWFNTRYVPFKQRQAEEMAQLKEVERQQRDRPTGSEPPPPPELPAPKPPTGDDAKRQGGRDSSE